MSGEQIMALYDIQTILERKSYYVYSLENPDTLDWPGSIEYLAKLIGFKGKIDELQEAINDSFFPDYLTKVSILNDEREEDSIPLIEALSKLRVPTYIWSEGYHPFQMEKIKRTGINRVIRKENVLISPSKKAEGLLSHIEEQVGEHRQHIIIIDDKSKKLEPFTNCKESGITFHTFCVKLDDQSANPTALYNKLKEIIESYGEDNVQIYVDLDGVLIDTDRAMTEKAPGNIEKLLEKQHSATEGTA